MSQLRPDEAPARQLRLEAVDHAAAVGVDQAADELLRVCVDDRALPVGEDDPAICACGPARLEGTHAQEQAEQVRVGPWVGWLPRHEQTFAQGSDGTATIADRGTGLMATTRVSKTRDWGSI